MAGTGRPWRLPACPGRAEHVAGTAAAVRGSARAETGPVSGDAFGLLLQEAVELHERGTLRAHALFQIVERDDGALMLGPAKFYLAEPGGWLECERRAARNLAGRVLDVGAGAGRIALFLQRRGIAVTALDTSPGAVEVCRRRGVRDVVCATIDEHMAAGERYDSFALFGNNLGLLESRERAVEALDALAGMASPGARLVGASMDPHRIRDPVTAGYMSRNAEAGRLPGQWCARERFRNVATPWSDFLWCAPAELERLIARSRWRLTAVDQGPGPNYAATLVLRR
jgi:SAM-dependent methyltransferase